VNEIAPKRYRNLVSFICFEAGAAAHAVLPGLAYALKDWRHLEIVCGILAIPFIPAYFFMKESPR